MASSNLAKLRVPVAARARHEGIRTVAYRATLQSPRGGGVDMRGAIKRVACDLLIKNGYRGLRLNDIAEKLPITRANIHYHFGTKARLVDEVIDEYITGTAAAFSSIWEAALSYEEKVLATMEFNRRRYLRFNKSMKTGGAAWSLISRMRLDADLLSERSRAQLRRFSNSLEESITKAIRRAQANGEIAAGAPFRDIAVQIISIIDSAGPITQDAGSFVRLEHLYLAHMRVVAHAYVSCSQAEKHRKARPGSYEERPCGVPETGRRGHLK